MVDGPASAEVVLSDNVEGRRAGESTERVVRRRHKYIDITALAVQAGQGLDGEPNLEKSLLLFANGLRMFVFHKIALKLLLD